jgi:hypothetical protein
MRVNLFREESAEDSLDMKPKRLKLQYFAVNTATMKRYLEGFRHDVNIEPFHRNVKINVKKFGLA